MPLLVSSFPWVTPNLAFWANHFVIVLALWLPPFRGRSLIFVPVITFLTVCTHWTVTVPLFSNQQNAHQVSVIWILTLSAIEKLLFTVPETAFWRNPHTKREPATHGCGWPKLKWAVELYTAARGTRWNFRVKGTPDVTHDPRFQSKRAFLEMCLRRFVLFYLLCDAGYCLIIRRPVVLAAIYGDGKGWYGSFADVGLAERIVNTILFGWILTWSINFHQAIAGFLAVGLGISNPEDWPPMFGPIEQAYTLRKFWTVYWHQMLRRIFVAYPCFISRVLGFKKGSKRSAFTQLYMAFILSGLGHALITFNAEPPNRPHKLPLSGYLKVIAMFVIQAVGITVEDKVIRLCGPAFRKLGGGWRWWRLIGFAWVLAFQVAVAPWLQDPFLRAIKPAPIAPWSVFGALQRAGLLEWIQRSRLGRALVGSW